MNLQPSDVTSLIRQIAKEEILPRFNSLNQNEVFEKKGGELVTIADIKVENRLIIELKKLLPGSLVIGEETSNSAPLRFEVKNHPNPIWIIDPIDGTRNFVSGKPCFAVMIALLFKNKLEAAWIHDPITDTTIHSLRGKGSWEGNTRLKLPLSIPIEKMEGSIPLRLKNRIQKQQLSQNQKTPIFIDRYRCIGREYMDLARGKLFFLRYEGKLKLWDHAPGLLINREIGWYDALTSNNQSYSCLSIICKNNIMLAKDYETWLQLAKLIDD